MGTLVITKTYSTGVALMEADIEAFRTGLHTLFNTDKFSLANFSTGTALTSDKFTGAALLATDDTYIKFGDGDDGLLGLDANKKWVFNTAATTTELRFYAGNTNFLEFFTDKIHVPGDIFFNTDAGGSGSILKALSSYAKPRLVYNGATSVLLENNESATDTTTIYLPTGVITVTEASPSKYRYAAITTTANGFDGAHTGVARGGIRTGSAASNTWYYTYAVRVRGGTDYSATAAKFIIVFDTVAPTAANGATIDGYYGSGNWVYLGLIRYGFGATGSSTTIPKFVYSRKGMCTFYEKASTGYCGLNLAYTSTDADNLTTALYVIAAGTSGNVIPATIGHVRFSLNRERVSDWKIRATSSSSSTVLWSGGFQTTDGTISHGHIVEIANVVGYSFWQGRKSSTAGVARAVCIAGFTDGLLVRGGGHGI